MLIFEKIKKWIKPYLYKDKREKNSHFRSEGENITDSTNIKI